MSYVEVSSFTPTLSESLRFASHGFFSRMLGAGQRSRPNQEVRILSSWDLKWGAWREKTKGFTYKGLFLVSKRVLSVSVLPSRRHRSPRRQLRVLESDFLRAFHRCDISYYKIKIVICLLFCVLHTSCSDDSYLDLVYHGPLFRKNIKNARVTATQFALNCEWIFRAVVGCKARTIAPMDRGSPTIPRFCKFHILNGWLLTRLVEVANLDWDIGKLRSAFPHRFMRLTTSAEICFIVTCLGTQLKQKKIRKSELLFWRSRINKFFLVSSSCCISVEKLSHAFEARQC